MSYVLGIDLGTSSLKGLLMDKDGQLVAQASADYLLLHPHHGYSEQDPAEWIRACQQVLTALGTAVPDFQKGLEGLAISGQMHGLVTLDAQGQVVRPAILWNDTRTTAQCQRLVADLGDELIAISKNKALEGFTLPKILWMQEHEPTLWEQVAHIMLPKDYLIWWLTGRFVTDYSDAAGTLLLDLEQGTWSQRILDVYQIDATIMPDLLASTGLVGTIRPELVEEFGFERAVQVVAGGADNACAAVGAGIVDESVGMVSIGTSGVFLAYETQAHNHYKGQLHLFNHGVSDAFYSMGVTLAAGHSLNWFKQTFAPEQTFEELLAGIDTIELGSAGLIFTPYIVGERTPYADSEVRGSFTGMDTSHTLKHFARSVLEGITFSLKNSQDLMTTVAGKTFKRIVSVGGGSKNPDWLQMQADIFETDIVCLSTEQGPGQGAAMLAAVGIGWFDTVTDAVTSFVHYDKMVSPIPENSAAYRPIYDTYCRVYPALKSIYTA